MRIPPELTALEAVAGCPLGGRARSAPRLARRGHEPLAALASVVARTLGSGPPAVAFSGGRDSSLLLAVAAHVCRHAGLEPPLPVTLCMASPLAETDELRWQERVLKHLQITDWRRIPIDGELDLIGPFARRHLLRDGLLFPANAHSIVPLLEAAGERCLIVGVGGDELLGPQQWQRVHDLLGRRRGPEHRDLVRLAACVLPRTIRGMARTRSAESFEEMKWLRPATRSRLARAATRGFEEPVLWRAAVRDAAARRGVILPSIAWERLA
ncbi:MAG TPA: asparagine synthase-related protein, partial [Solirubrobacteraceae bacterium]